MERRLGDLLLQPSDDKVFSWTLYRDTQRTVTILISVYFKAIGY